MTGGGVDFTDTVNSPRVARIGACRVTVLTPGRDVCERCRSSLEKAGYFVSNDGQGTRVFYCLEHMVAALREGLTSLRVVGSEA